MKLCKTDALVIGGGGIHLLTAKPSELEGRYAAERAVKRTIQPGLKHVRKAEDEIRKLMKLRGQMNVKDVVGSIRDIMWRNVSVVREEKISA